MIPALVVLFALLARPGDAVAQSEHLTHVAIGAYMTTAGADLAVTTYGLGAGVFREANPLLRPFERHPVGMAAVKMGLGAGLSAWLLHRHQRSPKATFWTAIALTALNSAITWRNTRLLP